MTAGEHFGRRGCHRRPHSVGAQPWLPRVAVCAAVPLKPLTPLPTPPSPHPHPTTHSLLGSLLDDVLKAEVGTELFSKVERIRSLAQCAAQLANKHDAVSGPATRQAGGGEGPRLSCGGGSTATADAGTRADEHTHTHPKLGTCLPLLHRIPARGNVHTHTHTHTRTPAGRVAAAVAAHG
jgi:hypothetical protein